MVAIDILEELSFFCDLTMEELALIAPLCTLIEGGTGDSIIQEGKLVPNLYILSPGKAVILKNRTVLSANPKLGCKLYKKVARILSERLKNRTEQLVQQFPVS